MRRLGSGKPRPPGSQGEPGGMPGTVATRLPKAAKPVAEQPRDVGEVEAHCLELAELVVELVGSVVVDALALAAVLEAVLEGVRVDPVEQPGEAVARLGEPAHVVVELQLEEVAVLAEMAGGGVREAERVVAAAHLLGADARRGVGPQAEPHLAPVVEREGARRAGNQGQRRAAQKEPGRQPLSTSPRRRRHGALRAAALEVATARERRRYRKALPAVSRNGAALL